MGIEEEIRRFSFIKDGFVERPFHEVKRGELKGHRGFVFDVLDFHFLV